MKKLFVALDNSKAAPIVLDYAIELAKPSGAELVLFQAVTLPVDVPVDIYYRPKDELPVLLQKEAHRELDQLAQRIPAGLSCRKRVEIGVPWQAICETAQKEDADMIVMGAHGYRFYERMLGTTAGRVVNHADRPVLVIRTIKEDKDK